MRLRDLMPTWFDGVYEMEILLDAQQISVDELQAHVNQVQDNQFVSTADLKTIQLYEKTLNMQVNSGDTLDVRRYKVLTKLAAKKPYTARYVMDLIANSSESLSVEMFYNEYRMLISIDLGYDENMSELQYLINHIRTLVPANINVQSQMKQYLEFRHSRKYHYFNFNFAGDYFAGEHPNISRLGDVNNIKIELNQDSSSYIFKSRLTGEHPQVSTLTDLNDGIFKHTADIDTYKVPYKFAGEDI